MVEISVVVTILNQEKIIPELIARLKNSLLPLSADFELIFIDDRSRDQSWKILKAAAKEDKRIKAARMSRNFGQHSALSAGIAMANGNYVVLMDGDLQDEPEVIPRLFKAIQSSGNEIVYVKRINRKDSLLKKFMSRWYAEFFSFLSGMKTDPSVGTFRIMTRLVCESYTRFKEVNKYVGGIFYWMDFESGYFETEHNAREWGRSGYSFSRLMKLAKNGVVSFSNKPLNLAVYLGFISAFGSLILGIYFILRKVFLNVSLTGYSSLIVSIYFTGGIILLVLGIIGQYIGQIYDQSKGRPEYLFQEKINFDQP